MSRRRKEILDLANEVVDDEMTRKFDALNQELQSVNEHPQSYRYEFKCRVADELNTNLNLTFGKPHEQEFGVSQSDDGQQFIILVDRKK